MKEGKTLQELAGEVQRISDAKKDFVADTRDLKVRIQADVAQDGNLLEAIADNTVEQRPADLPARPVLNMRGQGDFGINDIAHSQLAGWSNIPLKYYNRMLSDAPHLLASNVNYWMTSEPKRRMVRTLDGMTRAFLSDRYRVLDNDELLQSVLPVLRELQVSIESADVTHKKLYLKCTFPKREGEIKKGDIVRAGFVLSNSEVGHGSVNVQPLVFRLVCTNGAVFNDMGMKKYHVGKITGQGSEVHQFFKDDTLKADDEAFMLKVRDTVKGAASEAHFEFMMNKMRESTERQIEGDPVKAVEVVQKKYSLLETERTSVLTHLIQGGDLSQYGVANAVTRMSQDVDSYDRASDLERTGGKIFELPGREWREIAKAA